MGPPPERQGRLDLVGTAEAAVERARGVSVEPEARSYILREVLADDSEWEAQVGLTFRAQDVGEILEESLRRAADLSRERGARAIDRRTAEQAFREIVEIKYECPYPFLIC